MDTTELIKMAFDQNIHIYEPKDKIKRWIFFVQPETWVRITKKQFWMVAKDMTEKKLMEYGMKKHLESVARGVKNPVRANKWVLKRRRILRYFDYKTAIQTVAKLENFNMPKTDAWVKFYISIPKSWSNKKKLAMCFMPHESIPDTDNLMKAFKDALMKQDKDISDSRESKFWIDGRGFIEVTVGELPKAIGYTRVSKPDYIK